MRPRSQRAVFPRAESTTSTKGHRVPTLMLEQCCTKAAPLRLTVVTGRYRSRREDFDCTEVYDPRTGHWTALRPMLEKRRRHRAAVVEESIYVLRGARCVENRGVALFSAEVLNPEQGDWVQVANMFRARCDFAVTIVEKKIYVAVGSQVCSTENQSLDDTEIFDTAPGACT